MKFEYTKQGPLHWHILLHTNGVGHWRNHETMFGMLFSEIKHLFERDRTSNISAACDFINDMR